MEIKKIQINSKVIMKLTKTEIKEMIKESVKDVLYENKQNLDEISINAKRRNEQNIEKVFNKKPLKSIKTLCVFTANNPDSTQTSSKFNKKNNKSLLHDLKQLHLPIVPAKGKFGNLENSYAVINISLFDSKRLNGKYEQTSFIYSVNNGDGFTNYYYEKHDNNLPYVPDKNDYVVKDTETDVNFLPNSNDNYTQIGKKLKYSIPFSIFQMDETITFNCNRLLEHKKIETFNEAFDLTIGRVGMRTHFIKNILYENIH